MKKILFLWTLRGLIKNLNKINIITPKDRLNDPYILYAKGLINKKIIDSAELVWVDPGLTTKTIDINNNSSTKLRAGINIKLFRNIKEARGYLKNKNYNYLFVRGNYKEWTDLTAALKAGFKMFYAADPEYWPTFWPKNYFDLIFVDENSQIKKGEGKYHCQLALLDKPINDKIFKPQKIKKKYDLCYVANFIFWKNHQQLFSALDKIPNSHKIKLVCAGKTFGRDSEIKIAAWKYHINLTLTGGLTPAETAKIINQSKIGLIVSEKDANPRTIAETLACDAPLIVNANLVGGKRLINKQTGIIAKPEDLPKKIEWMLKNYKKFKPAQFYQKNLKLEQIINRCFVKHWL